jgi:hypothetical protein
MSNTYTNLIERMDCYPTFETKSDVVCTIFWRMNATDGEYSATAYGSCGVTWKEGDPFTPYEDLTFDEVWSWVASIIDVPAMKESLDKQIEAQINPPIVSPPLPWATPTI